MTGFFLERQYDLKVGQPVRVEDFSFTPLDLKNAYVSQFKVVQIKPKKKPANTDEADTDKKRRLKRDRKDDSASDSDN